MTRATRFLTNFLKYFAERNDGMANEELCHKDQVLSDRNSRIVKDTFEHGGKRKLKQAFLEVKGSASPNVVLRELNEPYPANLVMLKGVVVEVDDDMSPTEDDAWNVCGRIAEKCREAEEHDAMCEHLAYAYSILCDYLRADEGDWLMSKETSETLIRGAIDRIIRAGKCADFNLEKYRSED